jgi:hypothetical protein
MSTDQLSPNQRRTQAARTSLSEKFSSPEERSEFYRSIGQKGNAGRVTLAPADAAVLLQALELLQPIAAKVLSKNGGEA